MRRLSILALALLPLLLLLVVLPSQAFAHGLGQSQNLPLPFWLYLFAAATVVLLSFVQISLLVNEAHALPFYSRRNLLEIGAVRAVLTSRPLLIGLRLLSVVLFLLVIISGIFGVQAPSANFAPTFVWIIWWVGLSFFTAFVGNIWPLINPWQVLFEWAEGLARVVGLKRGLHLGEKYPESWGIWPALVLYAGFIWIENDFAGSATPLYLAVLALNYSVLTWGSMLVYGKETWLQKGEAFSVYFGILGRFAPTEVRVSARKLCHECSSKACQEQEEDGAYGAGGCVNCYECFATAPPEERELNLRPPAVGLSFAERVTPERLVFVVFLLASVTYDSLLGTPPWVRLEYLTSLPQTLGIVLVPLLFLGVYLGFVKLSQLLSEGYVSFGQLAAAYVYSLVPIAIAYLLAHYYTLLLVQGQAIIALLSDPFGWGWDLFGTADYGINAALIGADTVWYSQVLLIVAGHVVAVYLAHVATLRVVRSPRLQTRMQYPMLALMICYTVFSLWILSQPVVEKRKNEAIPTEFMAEPAAPIQPAAPTENAPDFDPTLRQPPVPGSQ